MIKKVELESIMSGPAEKPVKWDKNTPIAQEVAPIARLKKVYWYKFLLRFLLVAAGIATNAAVINPPTILTPIATTTAMHER